MNSSELVGKATLMQLQNDLADAISDSFAKYNAHGPRSTEKLKPLHGFVAAHLASIFGAQYRLHYLGNVDKELPVEGKYYTKDIDITVTQAGKVVLCVGIKFVTSNYKQNANNYFESMMGETANIQAKDGQLYAHLIILRRETPYYKKDRSKETKPKIEYINEKDLQKYIYLAADANQAHRPFVTAIVLADIDEKTNKFTIAPASQILPDELADVFEQKMSLENFFREINNQRILHETKP